MSISDSKKMANVKWDKTNMTNLACRVTRDKATQFKEACTKLETNPNAVLLKAVNETIEKAEGLE